MLSVGIGNFVLSIKILWEHYCDLDPKNIYLCRWVT